MNRQELRDVVLSTLDDERLSRGERKALREVLAERDLSSQDKKALRADLVRDISDRMKHPTDRALLHWLTDALALLAEDEETAEVHSRVLFGPADPMVETLVAIIGGTRQTLDVAVFTITDNQLRDALIAAHRRGVQVRILTDEAKSRDLGSDVASLEAAGLAVVTDHSRHHFHHKFAVFDGLRLVTGSYNWTRGADRHNRENFLVTDDPTLVTAYQNAFEAMWQEMANPA